MAALDSICHVVPSQDAGRRFMQRGAGGRAIMLNLLRLRDVADYTSYPELAPTTPISGAEVFDRYIRHTLPFLRESGGGVMLLGAGGPFLIGPENERWDLAMLVRQSSVVPRLCKP
ncbi:hypothetical protein GGD83_003344 [Rhodoblastus sphagnicola]|uniref:DUF1330 domain-containing protein n=1 Tax=Rhodoblastus sphagnicola TaxID=333368 RepID=UPI00178F566F|nr:DUF1330 domain-containing protein [Rhodoblastus sphagnicola]MBB4199528.1 hypothetical protein [Rhodoblastus sphagnicola]